MLACVPITALNPASMSSKRGFLNQLLADTISSSLRPLTTEGRTAEEPPFLSSPLTKEK